MNVKVILRTVAVLSCVVTLALADTKIRATYNSDDRVTETATYTKGERQRIEYGKETVVLNQGDLRKIIQLNAKSKTYRTVPTDVPQPAGAAPRQGAVVMVSTNIVDTGERKQALGSTAPPLNPTAKNHPSPAPRA